MSSVICHDSGRLVPLLPSLSEGYNPTISPWEAGLLLKASGPRENEANSKDEQNTWFTVTEQHS